MLKPKQAITFILFIGAHFISFAQGKLIMNGATMNVVNSAYVVTKDVSLTSSSSLNINNSTIKIAGSISNNSGNFDVTTGTVEMNGLSSQTIPANSFATNKIKNLIVSNDVTLAGEDSITDVLSFGSSNKDFATGGLLTLKSTPANTARVADITNGGSNSGNTISGNVRVERYIHPQRAWRLLTAPISSTGAPTINAAWQEGQTTTNNVPGFGTHITGGSIANGFDQGVNLNPSLKIFSGGTLLGVSNTNATSITSQSGYMLFVRGGRDVILSQGVYATPTPTVLRSTGTLKTNNQNFTVAATGFTVIGNPYAAPLNLYNIAKANSTNIQDNFYLWDPAITGTNGVGGYVNISWNGSSYDITPSSGGSGLNQYVQSGSAFLVNTIDGATPGTLVIKETDKSTTPSVVVNRPVNNTGGKLITNLYSKNSDGTVSIVDGVLNSYGAMYSNNIDKYDALKLKNISENLSIQSNGQSLSVERKQMIGSADTIFYNLLQEKVKGYKFEFVAQNLNVNGLTGFLEDSYLNTSTPINLNGTTTYDFTIANIPGSWYPGRFRIVFRPAAVLPVTFSNVKAFPLNSKIQVDWKIENEVSIKEYEVEKSVNGQQFTTTNTEMVKGSNKAATYSWIDENPAKGNNFYRIKSIGVNGEIQYSSIVKVVMGNDKQQIIVPANQLANGDINFTFSNMPAGSYEVKLLTTLGQVIKSKKIKHQEGTGTERIELNGNNSKGIYMLEIMQPDNKKITNKILLY